MLDQNDTCRLPNILRRRRSIGSFAAALYVDLLSPQTVGDPNCTNKLYLAICDSIRTSGSLPTTFDLILPTPGASYGSSQSQAFSCVLAPPLFC